MHVTYDGVCPYCLHRLSKVREGRYICRNTKCPPRLQGLIYSAVTPERARKSQQYHQQIENHEYRKPPAKPVIIEGKEVKLPERVCKSPICCGQVMKLKRTYKTVKYYRCNMCGKTTKE